MLARLVARWSRRSRRRKRLRQLVLESWFSANGSRREERTHMEMVGFREGLSAVARSQEKERNYDEVLVMLIWTRTE